MNVDPYTCARCGGLLDNPDGPRICGPCKTARQPVLDALKAKDKDERGLTWSWVPEEEP